MSVRFDTQGFVFALKFLAVLIWALALTDFFSGIIFSALSREYYPRPGVRAGQDALVLRREREVRSVAAIAKAALVPPSDITIALVGDVMLARGVEAAIREYGQGDFQYPFLGIREQLQGYDLLFGNLEGPISDRGTDQLSRYSFRMDPRALAGLTSAGFDIVNAANNHIGDWGTEAIQDTLGGLSREGIGYVGAGPTPADAYAPLLVTIADTRIAFLAFTESLGGYANFPSGPAIAVADEAKVRQSVERAESQADIVIVSSHFGEEYSAEPNEHQRKTARLAVDAGADLVVGHHPHVAQPIEKYGDSYIGYSLGNFVFDQDFSEDTMRGLLVEVTIGGKVITAVRTRTTRINKTFQTELVRDSAAE
jgi:poly-gamma-glutamate synthesis protein (capsule biosynthesis protein)